MFQQRGNEIPQGGRGGCFCLNVKSLELAKAPGPQGSAHTPTLAQLGTESVGLIFFLNYGKIMHLAMKGCDGLSLKHCVSPD